MLRKTRICLTLTGVLMTGSLALAAAGVQAHVPNSTTQSFAVESNGMLTVVFTCDARHFPIASSVAVLRCYTISTNGFRADAAPKSGPGPYVGTGSVKRIPILPYQVCVQVAATHDGVVYTGTLKCNPPTLLPTSAALLTQGA